MSKHLSAIREEEKREPSGSRYWPIPGQGTGAGSLTQSFPFLSHWPAMCELLNLAFPPNNKSRKLAVGLTHSQ